MLFRSAFLKRLGGRLAQRRIGLRMTLRESEGGVELAGVDEDGTTAAFAMATDRQPAEQPDAARHRICEQLKKLGNTLFACEEAAIQTRQVYFMPVAAINTLKRGLVERMAEARAANRPVRKGGAIRNAAPYPAKQLTWRDNVLNEKAAAFYRRHGVEQIERAAESGVDLHGQTVMTTKYCLRRQLGLCEPNAAPLLLEDEDGRQFRLRFLCGPCGMELDWIK